jgi:Holliday junction resolvase RusA-like endonuclease
MSPNFQLEAFKGAVIEALADDTIVPFEGPVELSFFFWRQLTKYESVESGRKISKQRADATNLQKALEDALQGIFFANDREVCRVTTTVVEQGAETVPRIVLCVKEYMGADDLGIPDFVWQTINEADQLPLDVEMDRVAAPLRKALDFF